MPPGPSLRSDRGPFAARLRSTWRRALAASLLLHAAAALACAWPSPRLARWLASAESGRASIALQATLACEPAEAAPLVIEVTEWESPSSPTPPHALASAALPAIAPERSPPSAAKEAIERSAPQRAAAPDPAPAGLPQRDVSEALARPEAAPAPPPSPTERSARAPHPSPASAPSPGAAASSGAQDAPRLLANPAPAYPADALAARRTGRVVVRASVAADGRVVASEVRRSSGHRSLDEAARAAVLRWRFTAAPGAQAEPRRVDVPVDFVLRR